MLARLLELLEQIPPLVRAHARRPVKPFLPHLGRDPFPQVPVRLRGVELPVDFSPETDQEPGFLLDPGLGPFLGGFNLALVFAAAAFVEDYLLVGLEVVVVVVVRWEVAVGGDFDDHVPLSFVEIDWARLFGEVHGVMKEKP